MKVIPDNIISEWADTHVFYNMYLHAPRAGASIAEKDEYAWRIKLVNETPNGHLLTQNSFFDTLRNSKKVYLAHATYNLDEILANKKIFSSGGCLTGSIYCVPLTAQDGKLRLHNLGVYIAEVEAPTMIWHKNGKKKPDIILFELRADKNDHHNLIGLDYLRMGEIHYSLYKQLEYLLSYEERFDLQRMIVNEVKHSLDYFSLCCQAGSAKSLNVDQFLSVFVETTQFLSILGYLYFEAVSEYLLLFQDNYEAKRYAEVGELYNHTSKELMYSLHPKLRQNFKLSSFRPATKNLLSYLERSQIFERFDAEHFKNWIARRLIYLTDVRLLGDTRSKLNWREFRWDFDNLAVHARPLLGHLIHRELRNFGRYPSFYFYFDQTKALQVWNYWNHMDIQIPFNGVVPKGEVGINPASPDLLYRVYRGKYSTDASGFRYVEPVEELDISIEPKLVDLRYSSMRAKQEQMSRDNL